MLPIKLNAATVVIVVFVVAGAVDRMQINDDDDVNDLIGDAINLMRRRY